MGSSGFSAVRLPASRFETSEPPDPGSVRRTGGVGRVRARRRRAGRGLLGRTQVGGPGSDDDSITPSTFLMGCVSGILCSDEAWAPRSAITRSTPVHEVNIVRPYALSVHEITRGEFGVFVNRTGYRTDAEIASEISQNCIGYSETDWREITVHTWRKPGFEQGADHPAVCISWNDASAYVRWLASETDRPYRLPSEAEWEYAARSNSTPAYAERSWYCAPRQRTDAEEYMKCIGPDFFTVTVRDVGSNAFGLYGMDGNAYEWVEDCWFGDYRGAPLDGSAWVMSGDCHFRGRNFRVVRDGGWGHVVRHEWRSPGYPLKSNNVLGFRIAQSHAE